MDPWSAIRAFWFQTEPYIGPFRYTGPKGSQSDIISDIGLTFIGISDIRLVKNVFTCRHLHTQPHTLGARFRIIFVVGMLPAYYWISDIGILRCRPNLNWISQSDIRYRSSVWYWTEKLNTVSRMSAIWNPISMPTVHKENNLINRKNLQLWY